LNRRFLKVGMVFICLLVLLQAAVGCAASPKKAEPLNVGAGMFTMPEATGANKNDLEVFYYRPANWTPDKPIVIVQHGLQRNAQEYRDGWKKYADQYNLLVVCPEFSEEKYPGVRYYNTGNVSDTDDDTGNLQPKDKWVFPVINHVFSEVRIRSGATSNTFTLFGHSAGAQLVHRYVLFGGQTQAERIISANAGWYSMPDTNIDFPYGIKNMSLSKDDLTKVFAKPVTILLGEKDNNPNNKVLRHTPQADAQGLSRFERGNRFFAEAKAKAAELGVPFNWKLITVPGVGHSDIGMAAAAAKLIAEGAL
jgi:poly(3-hydroxybutyrate) depolymerase